MSSPMMKRMLGFCCCCAAAGRFATIPTATNASRAGQSFRMNFIEDLLTFRLGRGRALEQPRVGLFYCRREQSLRLETRINHASLVRVRSLHILRLPSGDLLICLCDVSTYRRIACRGLLPSLRGRRRTLQHHATNAASRPRENLLVTLMVPLLG